MIRAAIAALLLATSAQAQTTYTIPAGEARAIDGDTFALGETRFRAWGIDTPERGRPGADQATRALAHILRHWSLTCTRKGRSYDRIVVQCVIAGTSQDPACFMVAAGLAERVERYDRGHYRPCTPQEIAAEMREQERRARTLR